MSENVVFALFLTVAFFVSFGVAVITEKMLRYSFSVFKQAFYDIRPVFKWRRRKLKAAIKHMKKQLALTNL